MSKGRVVASSAKPPNDLGNIPSVSGLQDTAYVVDRVIQDHPDEVARVAENPSLSGWFVGQVMKETDGQADPKIVNELVQKALGLTHNKEEDQ